jgi:IS5 family transposase
LVEKKRRIGFSVKNQKPTQKGVPMRRVLDQQIYLDFNTDASLKVVRDYRAKYERIDKCLLANPKILFLVHEDLEKLSISQGGREATYTTEILFRALMVHQFEETSLRKTIIRIAESPTLQAFIRLGHRSVPDYTFLNKAFKALRPETWMKVNEELRRYAVKECEVDVSKIRADTTVIESNIRYPTDSSLLWDSYRVLTRLLRAVRAEVPELCPHRFHDRKVKKDLVYVNRYFRSGSKARKRLAKSRFRRLHQAVCRLLNIAEPLSKIVPNSDNVILRGLGTELEHYLGIIRIVCDTAERAGLKGETVPASERVFSIFEEHAELIKRGKRSKPVEFGHAVWLAQSRSKFITGYEVMKKKVADSELLEEITRQHKSSFHKYPELLTADTGFRAKPEKMVKIHKDVPTVAVPGRGLSRGNIETCWHHFRAGIEGSISVLKRAFRLSVCMYRGFKSFSAAVGMAVFCHNLINLAPKRAPI